MPIDFRPPVAVRKAARRGLELHRQGFGGKGLRPETIAWARRVAAGQPIDAAKAVKGRAWHARHAVDERPGWDELKTPGYVANQLWFGEPGREWFEKLVRQIRAGR